MTADADSGKGVEDQAPGRTDERASVPVVWRDLGARSASGLALVALALWALWSGGQIFEIFWLIASFGVLWEWQSLIGGRRIAVRLALGAVALAAAADLAANSGADSAVSVLALGALAIAAASAERRVWSAFGLIYAGAALTPVLILRNSIFDGREAVLWLFAVVWGCDVMAYFGGRALGGPKLWPRVSPGKTWSGLLCGIASGAVLGWIALRLSGASTHSAPALALGALLAIAAQAGDLFESFVKRRFGAKDSSRLIPGHGGLMDRLDGFIVAAALAALLGVLRYDAASAALGLLRW